MINENEKLRSLTDLGIELNQVHDLDILLEHVLSRARAFTGAEAGSIYLREGTYLKFSYTQNSFLEDKLPEGEKLIYSTFTIPIDSESLAGYVANSGKVLNIKDVYVLQTDQTYQFNDKFDEATGYRTRSVLTMPLQTSRHGVAGVLQVINPRDEQGNNVAFSKEDEEMMLHFASIAAVAVERAQMTRAIILRMIRMAEMRDPKETGAHVNRVAAYSVEIYEKWARKHGVDPEVIQTSRDLLRLGAMLHDVGKVAIADSILKKPGRFSAEEFEIMKQHTYLGARLFRLKQSEYDDVAEEIILNHHERWDGAGYPGFVDINTGDVNVSDERANRGKKEDEIPLFGRIVALADVYDALSSKRSYKEAWDEEKVLSQIKDESGKMFDPELVEIFFSCQDIFKTITARYNTEN